MKQIVHIHKYGRGDGGRVSIGDRVALARTG